MDFIIEWHERLGSTNAYMKECFFQHSDFANGTLIAAHEQTAGRGRQDRNWLSAPGTNLCFSLFIDTQAPLLEVPSLTMAAALAVNEALNRERIPAAPKWPNDVLVGQKKICGILSERVQQGQRTGMIVGIGLNVNMSSEEADSIGRPATSMLIESGRAFEISGILDSLLAPLEHWIGTWAHGGFPNLQDSWTQKAGPIGKPLTVHDGPIIKRGTLAGFGRHGELLLQTENDLETIWSGDVS